MEREKRTRDISLAFENNQGSTAVNKDWSIPFSKSNITLCCRKRTASILQLVGNDPVLWTWGVGK